MSGSGNWRGIPLITLAKFRLDIRLGPWKWTVVADGSSWGPCLHIVRTRFKPLPTWGVLRKGHTTWDLQLSIVLHSWQKRRCLHAVECPPRSSSLRSQPKVLVIPESSSQDAGSTQPMTPQQHWSLCPSSFKSLLWSYGAWALRYTKVEGPLH